MKLAINNVHLDLGAGRRGTDMGPSAIHVAGLIDKLSRQGHCIEEINSIGSRSFESLLVGNPKARFLPQILKVCTQLQQKIIHQLEQGWMPIALGGDHSLAIGSVSGAAHIYHKRQEQIGIIWVDAHTDMNTPQTSPSGNIHGMPLSTLMGHGHPLLLALNSTSQSINPKKAVIIGARDVDITEIPLVKELGVRVITMSEVDRRGVSSCIEEAIEIVNDNTAGVWLSFDLDGVDPRYAPGVGTPVQGGLSLRESHLLCEMIASSSNIIGMDMVELNPTLDMANQTGRLAMGLILSALGKTII